MEIYRNIAQGSEEWEKLRVGVIGGSSISDAVAVPSGRGMGIRKKLMNRLVGEILEGKKRQGWISAEMQEGVLREPEARTLYELLYGVEVEQVGFVSHSPHKGCSPDGLVNPNGMIEIKTVIPSTWVEVKETGNIDTGYRRQMQWGLFVCDRKWCDYLVYCPYIQEKVDPLIVIRVDRDEKEIDFLNSEADRFIQEMQSLLLRVMKGG